MVSIGFIVGIIFSILITLGMLAFTIWAFIDKDGRPIGFGVMAVYWLIIAPLIAWCFWPYDMAYHSYRPVSGTVAEVNRRQVSTGDNGFEEKIAIRLTSSDQIYGCTDTRCALAKKGDHIALSCIRTWVYASVPGYDCRYNQ
jgi:hypothetical protein